MSLSSKTLFFLSAEHFQAYTWDKGSLSEAQSFTNDLGGREQFATYLKQHRAPAYLLVDVIEEDFRLETVPHLTGKNRRALIARKFEQYYRNTPFRLAKILRRQAEGRRDDEMLFSALTNPQRILPWLDTLLTNFIPLIAIHSLPNISAPLLKGIESNHVLLLSWEKHAGLRQTYFHQKHLHFSRLTPIDDNHSFSETVANETPRIQQYLKSLSLPPQDEILDVYIICHEDDKQALAASLHNTPDLHYVFLDMQTLGDSIKANAHYPDSDATPLFLHLLATQPPRNHYANSTHTHYYLLWQLRWLLFGLAAAITLASIIWSINSVWQGRDYASETEPLLTQATRLTRQAADITDKFPPTAIPAADMKIAVALVQKLSHYSPLPEEILSKLSNVLDQFGRIRLNKITWQSSDADAASSAYPSQIITFDGELLDFGSDYRSALAYLDRFQLALSKQGYVVTAQSLPLDTSPKGSISSDLKLTPEKEAQFTLKLIWRQAK
jgi:hypothetical protein